MLTFTLLQLCSAIVSVIGNVTLYEYPKKADPAADQLALFKERYEGPIGIMTISNGAPTSYIDATNSLNTVLINNNNLLEILTHLNRERIPERVVHAKAVGAFGYFEVTNDITDICSAELFSRIGKKTPVAVRLSSIRADRGGTDVERDARGFAVKFYTQDGNFDIVGLNLPMFVVKDPLKFPNFIHAIKRNPVTNLRDFNSYWDFFTSNPESFFQLLLQFSDIGIPAGYDHMSGYGVHTFQVVNVDGIPYFVRFYFTAVAGIKTLTTEEAKLIAAEDPDYYNRMFYNAIARGDFPCWTVSVQVLTLEDVKKCQYDVFDVTRIIPFETYPLKEVGKLILNRNPKNYFAEIEQLAFCPGNLVPGIKGDPSKLFEARRFSYRDAQFYRLGANFNNILVNYPYRTNPLLYSRDGAPPVEKNDEDAPNYYRNSFNGPVPYMSTYTSQVINIVEKPEPNNFEQATEWYLKIFTSDERIRLVKNIVTSLKRSIPSIQQKAVAIFAKIHPDLGRNVAQGLKVNDDLGMYTKNTFPYTNNY